MLVRCLVLAVFSLTALTSDAVSIAAKSRFKEFFDKAVNAVYADDFQSCVNHLKQALIENPLHVDANQLLGTCYMKLSNSKDAVTFLSKAAELDYFQDPGIVTNYVEALRSDRSLHEARNIGNKCLGRQLKHPTEKYSGLYFNMGVVEVEMQNYARAVELLQWNIRYSPDNYNAWKLCSETLVDRISPVEGEAFLRRAIAQFPSSFYLHFMLGVALHHQKKLDDALNFYFQAEQLEPRAMAVKANIGAALQALGRAQEAVHYYELCLPHMTHDAGVHNNYGALLGTMNRKEEEVLWLKKALALDPGMEQALVNLGGYYQDEGLLGEAREHLTRALPNSPCPDVLRLRIALMMSPVSSSWEQMVLERRTIEDSLERIARERAHLPQPKVPLDTTIDRIHFYIQYHGLNDRRFQESVVRAYHSHLGDLNYTAPHLNPVVGSPIVGRKARVAFISKFFGIFEPHGMLLDGIMKYLPRTHFTVIALPVARTDIKPLSPGISEVADEVVEISLTYVHALEVVKSMNVDVLVFADSMSEPMTHFLVHNRFAKIQVLFWGNPITSGSPQVDYFVSADVMEHPFRNRMPVAQEPYTEQVVTLEGQGIWYERPVSPDVDLIKTGMKGLVAPQKNVTRADFGLRDDWFLFLLPQSVFKIHPLYDRVLADILRRNPAAHLVVTGGRRPRWTDIYLTRLREAIPAADHHRLHMIERVSSEKFDSLLLISDVILHPFPFDGSKTAADALNANKPIVTLPTEYLRGRMGLAFLKTMNMPELVARNVSEYVDIASRLCQDPAHYQRVVRDIRARVDLIWQDLEVPYAWTRFLSNTLDVHPVSSFEAFVRGMRDRDFHAEMARHRQRLSNRAAFDAAWGSERYMLDGNGVASLEFDVPDASVAPRIFNNWKSFQDPTLSVAASSSVDRDQPVAPSVPKTVPKPAAYHETNHIKISPVASPVRMSTFPAEIYVKNIRDKSIKTPISSSVASDSTLLGSSSFGGRSGIDISIGGFGAAGGSDKAAKDKAILNAFRSQLAKGRYKESHKLGLSVYESQRHDPLYLIEMGVTQYFSGEYQSALDYCQQAALLAPEASLVYSCIGVSAMYLDGRENVAIDSFQKALGIMNQLESSETAQFVLAGSRSSANLAAQQLFSSVFSVTRDVIQGNLMNCYRTFKRYEDCLDMPHKSYDVPPAHRGGAYIVTYAAVDWSEQSRAVLHSLEGELRAAGVLDLPADRSLVSEIERVQTYFPHIVDSYIECLTGMPNAPHSTKADVLATLMNVINLREESRLSVHRTPEQLANPSLQTSGIVLLVQYYQAADPATQHDMDVVLTKNLVNAAISEVYMLNERTFDFSSYPNSYKIVQHNIGERLTFKAAFEFANRHLAGRTVILANADIYFDHTLLRLNPTTFARGPQKLLTLLKWFDQGKSLELSLRTDSQDAWIFQSPVDEGIAQMSDFHMGIPRCDNRIAHIFHTYNYTVTDPAFALHAIEMHSASRASNLYGMGNAAYGTGRSVLLSDQFVF